MLVLALDTSTAAITAGVVDVDADRHSAVLLSQRCEIDGFGHAELLMPLLHAALADSSVALSDAVAVVVGLGPGPFTGLRVGIATAAALGDGLGVPVFGVPSHEAFAAGLDQVLVVTDARRREVHASVYADGQLTAGPAPVRPDALAGWLAENGVRPTLVTGAAADAVAEMLDLPAVKPALPTATALVGAAARSLTGGETPAPLTPLYLRRPDATEPSRPKSVLG